MSVGSVPVKVTAKTALKNNYLKVAVSCMVLIFTWLLCINFAGLLSIVTGEAVALIISVSMHIFLVFPLSLGVLKYVWRMLFGVIDNPTSIFYWFSKRELYLKSIKLILHLFLRTALWATILNIPSLLLLILSKSFVFEFFNMPAPIWTANLGYYSILLRNISFVVVFFIMLKFYIAPVLFVADDTIDINEALYTSCVISRKSSIDFVSLIFSCFGWVVLSLLLLPLPFTLPLLISYYCVHVRFAVEEYNLHIENSKFTEAGFFNE